MNLIHSFLQPETSTGGGEGFTPQERAQLLANLAYVRGRVEALPADIATEASVQEAKDVGLAAKESADQAARPGDLQISGGFDDEDRARLQSVEGYFNVLPPQTPAIVVPAPVVPTQHLVPVLFHSSQFGVTDPKAQVQLALVEQSPILIEGVNEIPAPVTPTKNTTTFPVYPGCFLWNSDYLESQGSSGLYYANSAACKLTKVNAQFRVPPLPVGKTFWFLAELLRMNQP